MSQKLKSGTIIIMLTRISIICVLSQSTSPPTFNTTQTSSPKCCQCIMEKSIAGCMEDIECENYICNLDKFCCNCNWDQHCKNTAYSICMETLDPTMEPTIEPTTKVAKPTTAEAITTTEWVVEMGGISPPGLPPKEKKTPPPTPSPTRSPTQVTNNPSKSPTFSPTDSPTPAPTNLPTISPSNSPTVSPSMAPFVCGDPTRAPTPETINPTNNPSVEPTLEPTIIPSREPTMEPTSISITTITMDTTMDLIGDSVLSDRKTTFGQMIFVAVPIESMCLLVTLIILIKSIYYFTKKTKKPIKRKIKIAVLFAIFCNLFGIICAMGICIIIDTNEILYQQIYQQLWILYCALTILYSCGKLWVEIFFVLRIFTTFKRSVFEIPKSIIIGLCLMIFLTCSLWCYTLISDRKNVYISIISLSLETVLIIMLLYLFMNRLIKIILQQKSDKQRKVASDISATTITTPTNFSDVNIELSPIADSPVVSKSVSKSIISISDVRNVKSKLTNKQNKLIHVITRCIVLGFMALITTYLFSLYVYFYVKLEWTNLSVFYGVWAIDMATNSICLYLNFIFADSVYRFCCKICHASCRNMVEYYTAKKIIKDNLDELVKQRSVSSVSQKTL